MAFNILSNVERPVVYFLETKPGNQSDVLQKRIFAFETEERGRVILKNVTTEEIPNIPNTLLNVLLESKDLIKGVFPIRMNSSFTGYIFLFEVCSENMIPCDGSVSYEYCVVADNQTNATDEGKPVFIVQFILLIENFNLKSNLKCHRNHFKPLFDCSNWKNTSSQPQVIPTTQEVSTSSESETYFTEEESSTTEETNPIPTETSSESSSISSTESSTGSLSLGQPKSLMSWLWILIVIIIFAIILIIILFLICRRRKAERGLYSSIL